MYSSAPVVLFMWALLRSGRTITARGRNAANVEILRLTTCAFAVEGLTCDALLQLASVTAAAATLKAKRSDMGICIRAPSGFLLRGNYGSPLVPLPGPTEC